MEMKKLKVAIIGAGFIGKQHIEAIRRIPGTNIVALADTDLEEGKRICEDYSIPNFYDDYMGMIEKECLDVVHICTPNFLHYEICKNLIKNKINVYCEKPLANTSVETKELCELAKENNIFSGVNFNYRQNAIVKEMHERVNDENDGCGEVLLVHGHYLQDWMMYETDYNWRCVPRFSGPSRTIADIGSHWFDIVQYITGRKIIRVFSDIETIFKQRKRIPDATNDSDYELVNVTNEDAAFIIVEFDNGRKGNLTLSQVAGGHKNDLQVEIEGSKYSMLWKQEEPDKLQIGSRENGRTTRYAGPEMLSGKAVEYALLPSGHALGWMDAFKNGIQEFYKRIRGDKGADYVTFEEGDYIARIVEACLESAEKKCWVEVK